MYFWSMEAMAADAKLRIAKGTGTPKPEVQAAVNILVRIGTGRTEMKNKLLLYKFTPPEVENYIDTAYPA